MILYDHHFRTIGSVHASLLIICRFCIRIRPKNEPETRQKYIGYTEDWHSFFTLSEKIPDKPKMIFFADRFMI